MQEAVAKGALALLAAMFCPLWATPQTRSPAEASVERPTSFRGETTDDYNQRLGHLKQSLISPAGTSAAEDYRIGPEDLLEISVFEAPELNRTVRVSATGEASLSLLGTVQAAGLTPKTMEFVLQELLRRT